MRPSNTGLRQPRLLPNHVGEFILPHGCQHEDHAQQRALFSRRLGAPASVYTLIEAALKTKSHKADGWYEMYGRCKIDTTEDAVFLDLDFDYGS